MTGGAQEAQARPNGAARYLNGAGDRPVVQIQEAAMFRMVDEVERILIDMGAEIFKRDRGLVRPIRMVTDASDDRVTVSPALEEFEKVALRDRIDRLISFQKFIAGDNGGRWVDASPPMRLAETLLKRIAEWKFRSIAGVISVPTFRRDGSILDRPGYDERTRLFLMTDLKLPPMPENPTREDALRALALLNEVLDGFPFIDEISRSVALSMLATPVARGAMSTSPLHGVTAPGAGTGKSFLADLAAAIYLGNACPILNQGSSEEELEKRLGAIVMDGTPLMSIDNCTVELAGKTLCQLLDRPALSVRVLGKSKMVATPNRFVIFATGNNLRVSGDMNRRSAICYLDAKMERPSSRHFPSNPVKRVLDERADFVAAVLIIVRAYFVAGRPDVGLTPLNSFEDWSGTVRSALVWLGCADPLANMDSIVADDPERQAKLAFLSAYQEEVGLGYAYAETAGRILKLAEEKASTQDENSGHISFSKTELARPLLAEALEGMPTHFKQKSPESLAKWLRSFKGLPVGDFVLKLKDLRANQTGFYVDPADDPSESGEVG